MTRRVPLQPGVTLMEMLIAVSIITILMLIVNQLFFSTSDAMSRGIQTGDVIGAQRAVSDQLVLDIVGHKDAPGGGILRPVTPTGSATRSGFLVIVNHWINENNPRNFNPLTPFNFEYDTGEGIDMPVAEQAASTRAKEMIRSDQLAFLVDLQNSGDYQPRSLTPADSETFASFTEQPDYARIWYGHVLRTNPDGSDPADTLLGTPDSNDQLGYNLILGRQAMFIYEPTVAPDPPAIPAGVSRIASPPVYNRSVTDGFANDINPPSLGGEAFMGWCDRAIFPLWVPAGPSGLGMTGPGLQAILRDGTSLGNYVNFVLNFTYVRERLRANPSPQIFDPTNNPVYLPLESWRIAQMHPIFVPNVSDFIVEFAADANNDGYIDLDALTIDVDGDGIFDVGDGRPDLVTSGDIVWYSMRNPPRTLPGDTASGFDFSNYRPDFQPMVVPAVTDRDNAHLLFVWRHDDGQAWNGPSPKVVGTAGDPANSAWPYMLRIRYRLHDHRGRLYSFDYSRRVDGLNNNEDFEVQQGKTGTLPRDDQDPDEAAIAGQWFEVILPVNRPQ